MGKAGIGIPAFPVTLANCVHFLEDLLHVAAPTSVWRQQQPTDAVDRRSSGLSRVYGPGPCDELSVRGAGRFGAAVWRVRRRL